MFAIEHTHRPQAHRVVRPIEQRRVDVNPSASLSAGADSLGSVIATAELAGRASRTPDYATEAGILASLARDIARSPESILQCLAQGALTSCQAGSAGISLIDEAGKFFRGHALEGELAKCAADARPPIVEALLAPFSFEGKPVGTIWVVTHEERRRFDAEDARRIGNLGRFAAAAFRLRRALDDAACADRQTAARPGLTLLGNQGE
jgi:hypothetical protein